MQNNISLVIEDIGQQGDGIAHHNGETIFVDKTLPDEEISANIYKSKDGSYRSSSYTIKKKSKHRQEAPCPHFHQCGGCQFQYMTEEFYKKWKADSIQNFLKDIISQSTKIHPPIFIAEKTRRRVSLHALRLRDDLILGYTQKKSHQIINIQECLLLDYDLQICIQKIRPFLIPLFQEKKTYDVFLQKINSMIDCTITGPMGKQDLVFHEAVQNLTNNTPITRLSWRRNVQETPETLIQKESLVMAFGNLNVFLPSTAFLQPSIAGENALINAVLTGLSSHYKKGADLFSGNGTFTGALLAKGYDIFAYESDEQAVSALQKAHPAKTFQRDLFKDPLDQNELDTFDFIVLDPPRAGAKNQCLTLAKSTVKHIAYVSCNPKAFIKDAKILIEGGYQPQSIQMIDQFTWSNHIEIVSHFIK